MFFTTIRRIVQSGFANFFRNSFVSLASVLVMTITLLTAGSLIFVDKVLESTLDLIESRVDINVYFTSDTPESRVLEVQGLLEGREDVAAVEYISRDEAYDRYVENNRNDTVNLEVLDELGENPFGAVLNVRAVDPTAYESINAYISTDTVAGGDGENIIRDVNFNENQVIIDRLTNIIATTDRVSLLITLIAVGVAIVITFNTFRLVIYMSRDEISVMKLVGASDDYIRGPFVVAGIITGLFAAILTMVILYPVTFFTAPDIQAYVGSINIHDYYKDNFGQLTILLALGGAFLGMVSSGLAVKRYLKI